MTKHDAKHIAQFNAELRQGMHRSVAHFRRQLDGDLNEFDRAGMKDLLDLLEDYMRITWPGPHDAV